jgi:hypothetical protein
MVFYILRPVSLVAKYGADIGVAFSRVLYSCSVHWGKQFVSEGYLSAFFCDLQSTRTEANKERLIASVSGVVDATIALSLKSSDQCLWWVSWHGYWSCVLV